jgi:hypothetical protein
MKVLTLHQPALLKRANKSSLGRSPEIENENLLTPPRETTSYSVIENIQFSVFAREALLKEYSKHKSVAMIESTRASR